MVSENIQGVLDLGATPPDEHLAEETAPGIQAPLRDNRWLEERLRVIKSVHFADVATGYPIEIRFGIRAKYRFGSIAARNGKTIILMNRLFADPEVPDYVIDGTIAHEMAHYAHGFGSGLPRLYADPHRGGVVDKELAKRGLGAIDKKSEDWREAHWDAFYASRCADLEAKRADAQDTVSDRWQTIIGKPGARTEEEIRLQLHRAFKSTGARVGETVFPVEWLHASTRQNGTSYWFPGPGVLRLHGLLADRRVPDYVVDFELAYWVVRLRVGGSWPAIYEHFKRCGIEDLADQALKWRRSKWNAFRKKNHPLMQGR